MLCSVIRCWRDGPFSPWEQFADGVDQTAKDDGADNLLKRNERVVDAEYLRGNAEVDEEDDDTQVDNRERGAKEAQMLTDEHNAGRETSLAWAVKNNNNNNPKY